jgi:hypothetical protein
MTDNARRHDAGRFVLGVHRACRSGTFAGAPGLNGCGNQGRRTVMHPWTTAIVGTVALSLAGASPGIARPKVSSAAPPEAPVFWPHASANLIEYIFFPKGRDDRFWGYGYGAIVDAAFSDPAASHLPPRTSTHCHPQDPRSPRSQPTFAAAALRPPMPIPGSSGSNRRSRRQCRNTKCSSSSARL